MGRPLHLKGDPLGRSYTPDWVAEAIMDTISLFVSPTLTRRCRVVEPCLGGGAFARAARLVWPGAFVSGWDVDPEAPGKPDVDLFQEMSAESADPSLWGFFDLAITNPPFGAVFGADRTVRIVENMRRVARVAAVLVPVDFLTQARWAEVFADAHVLLLIGRPFSHERGMAVAVMGAGHLGRKVLTIRLDDYRPKKGRARRGDAEAHGGMARGAP